MYKFVKILKFLLRPLSLSAPLVALLRLPGLSWDPKGLVGAAFALRNLRVGDCKSM